MELPSDSPILQSREDTLGTRKLGVSPFLRARKTGNHGSARKMCLASWTQPMLWRAPPWGFSERRCSPGGEDKSRCTPGGPDGHSSPLHSLMACLGQAPPLLCIPPGLLNTHHPEPSHILFTHTASPPSEHSPHFTSARPSADTLDSVLALFCSGSLGQWRPPGWLRGGRGVSDLGNGPMEGVAGVPSWTIAQGPRWSWRD